MSSMRKPSIPDILNGSSCSVIIKNDSVLDCSSIQIENDEVDKYDLEVQKPSEREKIINDISFFKRLSHKFYADRAPSLRSLPTFSK